MSLIKQTVKAYFNKKGIILIPRNLLGRQKKKKKFHMK